MSEPRTASRRTLGIVVVAALVIVVLDQLTKTLALENLRDGAVDLVWTLRLNLSINRGAAFSLGTGLTPLITVVAAALVAALVVFARHVTSTLGAVGLGLLIGGALGNLFDRLFRGLHGGVVDFIDLQWWPIFNVADIAVSIGAITLIVATFLDERRSADA